MLKISLVVLGLAFCALATAKSCPGCIVEHDPNDPEARTWLQLLLDAVDSNEEVTAILRYATQLVNGTNYYFTYETKSGKTCEGSYWFRSGQIPDVQRAENKCT